jgi:hypothetical protein
MRTARGKGIGDGQMGRDGRRLMNIINTWEMGQAGGMGVEHW